MKSTLRILSIIAAAAVVIGGLHLAWQHFSRSDLQGHYDPLGAFMNYVVRFGLIAVVGLIFGIIGKTPVGIWGSLSYLLFVGFIYLID